MIGSRVVRVFQGHGYQLWAWRTVGSLCASFWRVVDGRYIQWLRVHVRVCVYRGRWYPRTYFVHPRPGPGFENRTTVLITTHGASSFRNHSRICISGTSFHALPTSELDAQTAALDPAQAEVMVSLGWQAGPIVGVLRACPRLVVPLVGQSRCRRIGDFCPPPQAWEEKPQRY